MFGPCSLSELWIALWEVKKELKDDAEIRDGLGGEMTVASPVSTDATLFAP